MFAFVLDALHPLPATEPLPCQPLLAAACARVVMGRFSRPTPGSPRVTRAAAAMAAAEAAAVALTARVAAEATTPASPAAPAAAAVAAAEAAAEVTVASLEPAAAAAEPPAVLAAPRRPRPPRSGSPGRPTAPPLYPRRWSGPPPRVPGGEAAKQARNRRRRPPKAARHATQRRLAAEAGRTPHPAYATRFRAALQEWVNIGAPAWVIRVLKLGYKIPWRAPPPQRRRRAYPQPSADLAFGHRTADTWVDRGFVLELDPAAAAQAKDVSPTFVVNHPKDRLVIDLSDKNDSMED